MRILVVEDQHKIANSIKKGLEQENYAVDAVYDGEQGFNLAAVEDYDLIILDRMLPNMDGLTIAKKLRSENIHTPILMLTAKGQIGDRVEGLDSGADDYLVKPFAFSELLARIRVLARRPRTAVGEVFVVEDLKLDSTKFSLTRGATPIELSKKEFSLLEYLMRHAGVILSKDQIISHVWSYDSDVLPNSVEVYIKHLREKIDKPFTKKTPLINTVRGFGYMIGKKI